MSSESPTQPEWTLKRSNDRYALVFHRNGNEVSHTQVLAALNRAPATEPVSASPATAEEHARRDVPIQILELEEDIRRASRENAASGAVEDTRDIESMVEHRNWLMSGLPDASPTKPEAGTATPREHAETCWQRHDRVRPCTCGLDRIVALETALASTQREFASVKADRDALRVECERLTKAQERCDIQLREICLMCGFDPADGEGISPEEVTKAVKIHLFDELAAALEQAKADFAWLEEAAKDYRDYAWGLIATEAPAQTPGWKWFVKGHRGDSLAAALAAARGAKP